MKKILDLAKKEVKLVESQRIVLILIILYPLLIVGSVMVALSGQTMLDDPLGQEGLKDITAATFADPNSSFDYNSFFEKMQDTERIELIVFNSEEEMRNALRLNEADVGFFVKTENEKMDVKVYYDNVSPLASEAILFITTTKIQQIGEDLTKEELTTIWNELGLVEEQLTEEKEKLKTFTDTLKDSQPELISLQKDLNEIDIKGIKEDINFFEDLTEKYENEIEDARGELASSKEKIDSYEEDINSVKDDFLFYSLTLDSILFSVQTAKLVSVEPVTTMLSEIEGDLQEQSDRVDSTIVKMDSALEDLNAARTNIGAAEEMLDGATVDLAQSKITLSEFSEQLDSTEKVLNKSREMVGETIIFQETTIKDLEETEAFLDEFVSKIDGIRQKSPEALVKPVTITESELYSANKMDVMLIVSLVIALLLTSILLTGVTVILEREQGISFRVGFSPTNKAEWLAGKVLGQMFFVLVITMIILGVATLFAGITVQGSLFDIILAVLLIPFSFVCISLAIARFANSFSTVVLSSLLIFIPMLLLSGLLFPTKLMPDIVAALSNALPLTIAKDLLLDVMLRGLSIDQIWGGLTTLLIYSAICLAIYFYGEKI